MHGGSENSTANSAIPMIFITVNQCQTSLWKVPGWLMVIHVHESLWILRYHTFSRGFQFTYSQTEAFFYKPNSVPPLTPVFFFWRGLNSYTPDIDLLPESNLKRKPRLSSFLHVFAGSLPFSQASLARTGEEYLVWNLRAGRMVASTVQTVEKTRHHKKKSKQDSVFQGFSTDIRVSNMVSHMGFGGEAPFVLLLLGCCCITCNRDLHRKDTKTGKAKIQLRLG